MPAVDVSRPLDPSGDAPELWGIPRARRVRLCGRDTGASVNVASITSYCPHVDGTHTECLWHIVDPHELDGRYPGHHGLDKGHSAGSDGESLALLALISWLVESWKQPQWPWTAWDALERMPALLLSVETEPVTATGGNVTDAKMSSLVGPGGDTLPATARTGDRVVSLRALQTAALAHGGLAGVKALAIRVLNHGYVSCISSALSFSGSLHF